MSNTMSDPKLPDHWRLAVNVERTLETGLLGKSGDDKYPCTGKRVVYVKFTKDISAKTIDMPAPIPDLPGTGRGNAYVNDSVLPDIGVHYWADLGTRLSYKLMVWVED